MIRGYQPSLSFPIAIIDHKPDECGLNARRSTLTPLAHYGHVVLNWYFLPDISYIYYHHADIQPYNAKVKRIRKSRVRVNLYV